MNVPDILRRLGAADRAWRRTRASESLLRSVKYIAAAVAVVIAADLIAHLGAWARFGLSVAAAAAVIAGLGWLAWRAFVKRGPLLRIARLLESRDQTLGSKLMNVLQLEEQATSPVHPDITRKLARRAIDDASHDLAGHQFIPLTASPTMRRSAVHAAIPLILLAVPALMFAGIFGREVLRFVDPFGDHPPFSFTHLTIVSPADDATRVVFKKPVTIEAEFSGHRPGELFLTVENPASPSPPVTVPMMAQGESRFVQQLDEVTSDLVIRVQTSNGRSISPARRIGVILTPQVEKTVVTVQPPAYTKLPVRESTIPLGKGAPPGLTALAGSTLTFRITSNRPLSDSAAAFYGAAAEPVQFALKAGTGDHVNTAETSLTAAGSGRLTFDLRDETGLSAERELAANLTVTHDLPPEIEITEPQQDGFIVDTFTAHMAVRATDDYGLKSMRLHTGVNGKFGDPRIVEPSADPPQRDAVETQPVTPASVGAKAGDVITFFAEATDIAPEPHVARTRTRKLEVITESQYNDYLRMQQEIGDLEEKYAGLQDDLQKLISAQRDLAQQAEDAAKQPVTEQQRDAMAAAQNELNSQLQKLAERMEAAPRDQPLYDLEKDLQKVLNHEAQAIRDSVAKNQKAMEQIASASPPGQGMQQLGGEATAQADRLDPAAKQGREDIDAALADAQKMQELLKSLSAFQQVYEQQKELAEQTQPYKDKPDVSDEDRLALQQMASRERIVGEVLEKLTDKLREDADNAQDTFPEAAQQARDLAEALAEANLPPLADAGARSMLAGRGPASHLRAEHLRKEMEKLLGQCQSCQNGMGGEFSRRMSMMRGMLAGNTFSQMAMCRKFGFGTGQDAGMGMSMGMGGMGAGGMMSMGSRDGPQLSLLGGEHNLGRRSDRESAASSKGQGTGNPSPGTDVADTRKGEPDPGVSPENRDAGSASSDAALGGYDDIVEAYFRKITLSKPEKP